jgi:hypothetical protein
VSAVVGNRDGESEERRWVVDVSGKIAANKGGADVSHVGELVANLAGRSSAGEEVVTRDLDHSGASTRILCIATIGSHRLNRGRLGGVVRAVNVLEGRLASANSSIAGTLVGARVGAELVDNGWVGRKNTIGTDNPGGDVRSSNSRAGILKSIDGIANEADVTETKLKIDHAVIDVVLGLDSRKVGAGLAEGRVNDGSSARGKSLLAVEGLLGRSGVERIIEDNTGQRTLGGASAEGLQEVSDILRVAVAEHRAVDNRLLICALLGKRRKSGGSGNVSWLPGPEIVAGGNTHGREEKVGIIDNVSWNIILRVSVVVSAKTSSLAVVSTGSGDVDVHVETAIVHANRGSRAEGNSVGVSTARNNGLHSSGGVEVDRESTGVSRADAHVEDVVTLAGSNAAEN